MLIDENVDSYPNFLETLSKEISCDALTINIPFTNLARGGNPLKKEISHPDLHTGNTFKFRNKEKVKEAIGFIFRNKNNFNFPIVIKPSLGKKNLLKYIDNPEAFGVKHCNLHKTNLTLYFNGDVTSCDISYGLKNIRDMNFDLKEATKSPSYFCLLYTSPSPRDS